MNKPYALTPAGFRIRKTVRSCSILVILLGVIAAIFGVATKLPASQTVAHVLANPGQVVAITLIALMYSVYLLLVVNHGLLQRSITDVGGFSSIMPFALLAAYLTVPFEYWVTGRPTEVSAVAFLFVYLAWFCHGLVTFARRRRSVEEGIDIADQFLWLLVDLLAVAVLVVDVIIVMRSGRSIQPVGGMVIDGSITLLDVKLGPKDAAISISVVGSLVQLFITKLAKERPVPDAIRTLTAALLDVPEHDMGIKEARSWFSNNEPSDHQIKVFDFGSGRSDRTLSLLQKLDIGREGMTLWRYDILSRWADYGPQSDRVMTTDFSCEMRDAEKWIRESDVIVSSHSLYEAKAVQDFVYLLNKSRDGTVVILRGGSPFSFVAPIVVYRLFSWMRPFYAACWDDDVLQHLMRQCGLTMVSIEGAGQPLTIGQQLTMSREDLNSFAATMEFHYGRRVSISMTRLVRMALDRMRSATGANTVSFPNPDLVYILVKGKTRESIALNQAHEFSVTPNGVSKTKGQILADGVENQRPRE